MAGPAPGDWGSQDPAKFAYWGQRTTAFHGLVQWAPTLDPERMKLNNQEMLLQAGVRIVFHAWAARPLVDALHSFVGSLSVLRSPGTSCP